MYCNKLHSIHLSGTQSFNDSYDGAAPDVALKSLPINIHKIVSNHNATHACDIFVWIMYMYRY